MIKKILLLTLIFGRLHAQAPSGGLFVQECSYQTGVYRFVLYPSGAPPTGSTGRDIGQQGDPNFLYIHEITYTTPKGSVTLGGRSANLFQTYASTSQLYDSTIVTINDTNQTLSNVVIEWASDAGQAAVCATNDPNCISNGEWGTSGNWKLAFSFCSALPITLNYFRAAKSGNNILVQWQTGMESNSEAFELQGSVAGLTWDKILTVKSEAVNGTSDIPITYQAVIGAKQLVVAGILLLCLNFKRRWLAVGVLILALYSCKKDAEAIAPVKQYKLLRLQHFNIGQPLPDWTSKILTI
jgi:hypothetical protein